MQLQTETLHQHQIFNQRNGLPLIPFSIHKTILRKREKQ